MSSKPDVRSLITIKLI